MIERAVLALAFLGLAAIGSNPGLADGALAVGLPARGPGGGFVYGIWTGLPLSEAQNKALNACRGIDLENNRVPSSPGEAQQACKLIGTFRDQCAAAAHNSSQQMAATGAGWAIMPTSQGARRSALAQCDSMREGSGPACKVQDWFCDGNAR